MANQWSHYAKAKALAGDLDYPADDIRLALMAAAYTPAAPLTSQWWADVVASELANGSGYTTNGVALANKSAAVTEANSWGTSRAATTAYTTGQIVRPASGNGHLYRAQSSGTTGSSTPTYPTTVGDQVADGTVTWEEWGAAILLLTSDPATWTGLSLTGVRYAWAYDRTPGSDATRPLLFLVDLGAAQTITNTAYSIGPDSTLGWVHDTVS